MGLVPSGTIVLKMLQSCEKLVTGRASQTGPRHIFHQCGIKLTGTDTVSLYISTYDLCMLETSFCLYAALLLVELMLAIASRLNSAPAERMLWPCLGHPLSCRGWPEQVAQRSDKSRVPEVSAERKTGLTPCWPYRRERAITRHRPYLFYRQDLTAHVRAAIAPQRVFPTCSGTGII